MNGTELIISTEEWEDTSKQLSILHQNSKVFCPNKYCLILPFINFFSDTDSKMNLKLASKTFYHQP